MDVVVVAFAQEQGQPVMAGVALAAYAGGSLVAGLLYGIVALPGSLLARFVGCTLLFALATQTLFLVGSVPVLVLAVFLAGLTIAPVLVAGISLVESRVARAALNEGLTWTTTGSPSASPPARPWPVPPSTPGAASRRSWCPLSAPAWPARSPCSAVWWSGVPPPTTRRRRRRSRRPADPRGTGTGPDRASGWVGACPPRSAR